MITRYEVQTWLRSTLRQTPKSNSLAALAKRVTSKLTENQSERVAMLGNVGPLKAFTGESQPDKPIETTYSIRNEKFQRGIALPGTWLRNDKTEQTRDRVSQLGQRYVQWPGSMMAQLINAGHTTACLDGQNFFSTTHNLGRSGVWSNDLTFDVAVPAAPTADEISKAINYAIAQMIGFPDDQGEPFNEDMEMVTIVCHHSKSDVFTAALEAVNLDTGTGVRTNALQFNKVRKQLIASPRMTGLNSANAFSLIRSDAQAAPFLFQENLAEHRTEILDENSDHYKKADEMVANVWAVGNAGYGLPQDAARVVLI